MAQKIVAGNWKMNLLLSQSEDLVKEICEKEKSKDVRVIVFPPALYLNRAMDSAERRIEIGIQNFSAENMGAHTGELAIEQIRSCGAEIGLIGHSERRADNAESNEILKAKVDAAIEKGFEFIFCCGEPLEEREAGNEMSFVKNQLEKSLFHLSEEKMKGRIIAYEPVWAIGTGKTATSQQAEDMHRTIRQWLTEMYSEDLANSVSILYGGSCKPSNAQEIFAQPNVDGGLIGGAALNAEDFAQIINSFE